jgi:DNA-directed RNA polymerase subunit RPC12/RpoP
VHRIHRTFSERFAYMAIYECRGCHDISAAPRRYRYQLGPHCRCPKCGTLRITRLKQLDKIDPMIGGPSNLVRRMMGGMLYHCRFCRLQFYDRRRLASENVPVEPESQDVALLE